jgi:hypothetical protein
VLQLQIKPYATQTSRSNWYFELQKFSDATAVHARLQAAGDRTSEVHLICPSRHRACISSAVHARAGGGTCGSATSSSQQPCTGGREKRAVSSLGDALMHARMSRSRLSPTKQCIYSYALFTRPSPIHLSAAACGMHLRSD